MSSSASVAVVVKTARSGVSGQGRHASSGVAGSTPYGCGADPQRRQRAAGGDRVEDPPRLRAQQSCSPSIWLP